MDELKLVDVTDNAIAALRQSGWIIKSPYFDRNGQPVFVAVRGSRVSVALRDHDRAIAKALPVH